MHAAHRTFPQTVRGIGLRDMWIQAVGLELPPAKAPCEASPIVLPLFHIDQKSAFQFCFRKLHINPPAVSCFQRMSASNNP